MTKRAQMSRLWPSTIENGQTILGDRRLLKQCATPYEPIFTL